MTLASLAIARRDLKAQLFSLRGCVVLFFFLIILGVFFQSFVYTFVDLQQENPLLGAEPPSLDQLIRAISQNLHYVLLMALPALTMASFAEEKKTKVFRLLLAAPLKPWEIVVGKYFAAVGLLMIVLVSSLVYIGFLEAYAKPDLGLVLTSYMGLSLFVASHVAFGIWVSSQTQHQFLAFIFTLAGIFLMVVLNWIAPHIAGSEGVEAFVKFLASSSHLEPFFQGLITVSDVGYFLSLTGLFLGLTCLSVEGERWR